jgi:hypothetical protein
MSGSVELTKLPDQIQRFLVDYAINFYTVVAAPRSTFNPNNPEISSANAASALRALGFASLSVVVSGMLWEGFVPDGGGTMKIAILLFVLLSWVIFSCFYHIAAKVLGGSASIFASLQIVLIVKSVVYLFAIFVSVGILYGFAPNVIFFSILAFAIYEAGMVLFVPLTLSSLNGFGLIRGLCLAVFVLFITLVPIFLFLTEIFRGIKSIGPLGPHVS